MGKGEIGGLDNAWNRDYTHDRAMEPMKRVVKVIRLGDYGGSRAESRRYWLTRPPAERIAALKELRAGTYRRLTGKPMPRMVNVVRPFRPA